MDLIDGGMDLLKISCTDESLAPVVLADFKLMIKGQVLPMAHSGRWFVPLYKKRLVNKRRVGRSHTANRPDWCLIPFTNDIF